MNKALEIALVDVITKATTGVEKSHIFYVAEAPEVVQQLLLWAFVHHGVWLVAGVFCLGVCGFCCRFCLRWVIASNKGDNSNREKFCLYGILGFLCFSVAPPLIVSNMIWFKIWLAPKIYLIEYAADLIK